MLLKIRVEQQRVACQRDASRDMDCLGYFLCCVAEPGLLGVLFHHLGSQTIYTQATTTWERKGDLQNVSNVFVSNLECQFKSLRQAVCGQSGVRVLHAASRDIMSFLNLLRIKVRAAIKGRELLVEVVRRVLAVLTIDQPITRRHSSRPSIPSQDAPPIPQKKTKHRTRVSPLLHILRKLTQCQQPQNTRTSPSLTSYRDDKATVCSLCGTHQADTPVLSVQPGR